jgi:flagellar biogenesis protein FliO
MTVSFFELVVRSVLALAVVLAIVAVGYVIARRRSQRAGSIGRSSVVDAGRGRVGLSKRRPPAVALEALSRVGLARNATLVAVRFGDQVLLVGVAEQAPTALLAQMSAEQWEDQTTEREAIDVDPSRTASVVSTPPSLLEALRQATARRG